MVPTECAGCGVELSIKTYKFKDHGKHCCSKRCIGEYRRINSLGPPRIDRSSYLSELQHEYEQRNKTVKQLATKFQCSVSQIHLLAKEYKWVKFKRTVSVRTNYRRAAALKIKRPLFRGEHVHHVDGVITNNDISNLHVFENSKKHGECHGSLERAAFELYRRGLIKFNPKLGEYYISKRNKHGKE